MKYLSLDPGFSHTGIAISHEGQLAEPLSTIHEKDNEKLLQNIKELLKAQNPDIIVIGIPHHGPMVEISENLSKNISVFFSGEIILHPEDLSSSRAKKLKSKHSDHALAAAFLLQDYLDSI